MKFRYIFAGLLMVFVMSMAVEAAGEWFTITCNDDGEIKMVQLRDPSTGEFTQDVTIMKTTGTQPVKGEVTDIKTIVILIGPNDPCVYQGGRAYCW